MNSALVARSPTTIPWCILLRIGSNYRDILFETRTSIVELCRFQSLDFKISTYRLCKVVLKLRGWSRTINFLLEVIPSFTYKEKRHLLSSTSHSANSGLPQHFLSSKSWTLCYVIDKLFYLDMVLEWNRLLLWGFSCGLLQAIQQLLQGETFRKSLTIPISEESVVHQFIYCYYWERFGLTRYRRHTSNRQCGLVDGT